MTQTLNRELRKKFNEVCTAYDIPFDKERAGAFLDALTDAALSVAGIAKKVKMPLDWLIATGQKITEDDLLNEQLKRDATAAFEQDMGFGHLPWWSTSTWDKFGKFVMAVYRKSHTAFQDYSSWRQGEGKFVAFSNRKIRENPIAYMDTGWPEFEASHPQRSEEKHSMPSFQDGKVVE